MVDFDARDDTMGNEIVRDSLAVVGKVAGGFIKEDDTADVVFDIFGREEEITVVVTILEIVLDT